MSIRSQSNVTVSLTCH